MAQVLPYFPAVRNTSNHFALMGMLRDLYGLKERTLTPDNWRRIDEAVREQAADPDRVASVLDKAHVRKVVLPLEQPLDAKARERFVSYEAAEHLFGAPIHSKPHRRLFKKGAATPDSAEELESLIRTEVDRLARIGVRAFHIWLHGDWEYRADVHAERVDALLGHVHEDTELSADERDELTSFSADITADAAGRHGIVIQLFHGMLSHTPSTSVSVGAAVHWHPRWLRTLTAHVVQHTETLYDIFLGTRYPSHEAASLSRVYANLTVSGAWWHAFTPSTLGEFFRDRLEMLPNTVWNAFYSDGYVVEWIYGKLLLTRHCLARALAGLVEQGFLVLEDIPEIARNLLHDNADSMYGE
jgi:hypothetical protein